MDRRSGLFKAGEGLLALSLIGLLVALFQTWWTVHWIVPPIVQPPPVTINGFSGWGWLSAASWILLTVSLGRVLAAQIRHGSATRLEGKVLSVTTLVGGVIELAGSLLHIATAPRTHIAVPGQYVRIAAGPDIAIAYGLTIIASGILMFVASRGWSPVQPLPADSDQLTAAGDRGGTDA